MVMCIYVQVHTSKFHSLCFVHNIKQCWMQHSRWQPVHIAIVDVVIIVGAIDVCISCRITIVHMLKLHLMMIRMQLRIVCNVIDVGSGWWNRLRCRWNVSIQFVVFILIWIVEFTATNAVAAAAAVAVADQYFIWWWLI